MQLKGFHTDLVVFCVPSSESVLLDPLLLESNDFTPSTRSSTSESISDSSPLQTREAQSDMAADIKVISAEQDKVMILQLVVRATTSGFNKINLGEEDFNPSQNNCLYFRRRDRKRNLGIQISYFSLWRSVNAVGHVISLP